MQYRVRNTRRDGAPIARGGFTFPADGVTYLATIPKHRLSEIRSAKGLEIEPADEDDTADNLGRLVMSD